ncbi:DeoR/GlpR family DNA-binding transcription regulator [Arsenicicoccus sp. oral taxon 190]|uniref:DeoR/GlpR family DNA-binding transcription regulator n=1 Tax=Arsenicicoccus sp. oral taxon 190 TaxID=1658671 RepID=UPI000679F292|nr:DeoR/GlpR family DNA-binding transcription regulator [Arsenicicoccus sp. oral taxon 190]AKT50893.1 ArsR family transcriptional regulator [Arsenicicoccus sp. oral taxon 190]
MRQAAVLAHLRAHGLTSVDDLAARLGASHATIRRDLHELECAGQVLRVHGGASLPPDVDSDEPVPFERVATHEQRHKEAIAARAARLVVDGDVVLLDIGTTTMLLARELRGRHITVVTSSLAVLDELRHDRHVELILLGGIVRRTYHSLVGVLTEDTLRQVRVTRAFLGTSGITAAGDVLDTTLVEVPVKRAMIASAEHVVLLADHTKLPGHGTLRVCGAGDIRTLVTDDRADPQICSALAELGTEVITA